MNRIVDHLDHTLFYTTEEISPTFQLTLIYPEHWLLVTPHLIHFHRQVDPAPHFCMAGSTHLRLTDITGTECILVLTKINFTH